MGNANSGLQFTAPNEDSEWPRGQLARINKPAAPVVATETNHCEWTPQMDSLDGAIVVAYDNCDHGIKVVDTKVAAGRLNATVYTLKREWLQKILPTEEDDACGKRREEFFLVYFNAVNRLYHKKTRTTNVGFVTGTLVFCGSMRRRGIVLYTSKKNAAKMCVAFVDHYIFGKISVHEAQLAPPTELLTENEKRVAGLAVACLTVAAEESLAAAETQAALSRQTLAAIHRRERLATNAPY